MPLMTSFCGEYLIDRKKELEAEILQVRAVTVVLFAKPYNG